MLGVAFLVGSFVDDASNCCLSVCLLFAFPAHSKGVQGAKPPHKRMQGGGVGGAFSQAAPRANVAFMRHLRAATNFVLKGVSLGIAAAL